LGLTIYVGNMPFRTRKEELQKLFAGHGTVESISIPTDPESGKPRGIAFVKMTSASEARSAIAALHRTLLGGRRIKVSEALPPPRPEGGASPSTHNAEQGG
jgi:RNA recognition motif-containing protein